jgi:hypothetical protein
MTNGMLLPDGTPVRWKAPVASVSPAAIGWPETCALHLSQETPSGMVSRAAFGTYTVTL